MKSVGYGSSALLGVLVLLGVTCYAGYRLEVAFAEIQAVTVTIEYDIAKILGVLMGGIAIPTAVVGFAKHKYK